MNRILLSACILGVTVPPASLAQSDRTPLPFEVATLKRNPAREIGVSGGCRGNDSRLAAADPRGQVPLGRCVITGARFDVQAKAEEPAAASEQQLLSMLQRFIGDEFHASTHREVREVPAFALAIAKKGPRNSRRASGARLTDRLRAPVRS